MSNTKNINTIEIGNIKLPGGLAGPYIFSRICQYLDIRSLLNFIETSLIKQLTKEFGSDDFKGIINKLIQTHPARSLYLLIERYKAEFPRGTPIVCACEYGRMDDVELFVNLHPYHKYITNRYVNGYRDDMTLKDMVNQFGKDSYGEEEWTPLMAAASWKEHFYIVKYLIEKGEADTNIADRYGNNALHVAAYSNKKDTKLIELLLTNMSLNSINKESRGGWTPLDRAYDDNDSPIRQDIIALIRSKDGKANCHDENGNEVEEGEGDLNY
jgi:ankyrin repeat protein